ncbi:tyrosine-type recombinase/integrase [Paenibacillus peoriae]|uniref:tyrosine-type recombinase/integrase n=2 Tax=Paenibacillus TaxID=44249 RepID=UPI00026C687C|nr:tyrosine-type recombinase/integrase [Paenibacillus peoriae]MEC0182316.1 tyrosine-type recombinase/integrase [Paenibacillus peoriae]
MTDHIQDFEAWLLEDGASKNTIDRYVTVAKFFIEWHNRIMKSEVFDPVNVSGRDLNAWKKYLLEEATYQRGNEKPKRYSVSSVNNFVKSIRTFFRFLDENELIKTNPALKIKPQKIAADFDQDPRWLERFERNKLLRVVDDKNLEQKNRWKFTRNRAIVYVQLYAGLRVSEVIDLETEDISFETGYLFVRDGKGGKARRIEMNKDLRLALSEWLVERGDPDTKKLFTSSRGGTRLTKQGVEYLYRTLSEKTGIDDLTTHVPRHTLAHDLIETGYSLQRVADILGHTNLNYTRVYTKSSSQERREALESLSSID